MRIVMAGAAGIVPRDDRAAPIRAARDGLGEQGNRGVSIWACASRSSI